MLREVEKMHELLEQEEQCPLEEMELSSFEPGVLDIEVNTNELVVFWLKSIVFTVLGVILRKWNSFIICANCPGVVCFIYTRLMLPN